MAIPVPYPSGMLLQEVSFGTINKPYSGPAFLMKAGEAIPVGSLVQLNPSDATQVICQEDDEGDVELFMGVCFGVAKNGVCDYKTAPASGELAAIAIPNCVIDVLLNDTVAAGVTVMPATVDGRVIAWTDTNSRVGFTLEGGVSGDLVKCYIHSMDAYVTAPA